MKHLWLLILVYLDQLLQIPLLLLDKIHAWMHLMVCHLHSKSKVWILLVVTKDSLGSTTTLETTEYYIPEANINLFSPLLCFSKNKAGSFLLNSKSTVLTLPNDLNLQFD